ncbi:MAG: hypothetical protein ACREON_14710 [Gemmatimonadaceae bacterium]
MRRALLAAALPLLAHGCSTRARQESVMPATSREWLATLDSATHRARAGDYPGADSALAIFAAVYPYAPEARESAYWRALLSLQPDNSGATLAQALAYLDRYLADSARAPGRGEASVLRRLVAALDSVSRSLDSSRAEVTRLQTQAANPPAGREQELEREVQKLKEQLAEANAELERIRRRLAAPRP